MAESIMLILYILVGAVAGMIYGLRRVFVMERKIGNLERLIARKLIAAPFRKKRRK